MVLGADGRCPSELCGRIVLYNHYRTMGPAEFPWEQSRVEDEWQGCKALISKIEDHPTAIRACSVRSLEGHLSGITRRRITCGILCA